MRIIRKKLKVFLFLVAVVVFVADFAVVVRVGVVVLCACVRCVRLASPRNASPPGTTT